ncbi:hypothetical protein PCASD_02803 [Puccinia coronata f. sp. avenae]|uniref:Retrotransposon gag domain-containing protein n=1 Tax=Puccinia coronata f. sp. avenae TaxID=200324 RepID=A0A2N5VFW5_9BASI|nr:hypothetical protein PCASD_02803 [Puccinia coronata f. sp. avenae]
MADDVDNQPVPPPAQPQQSDNLVDQLACQVTRLRGNLSCLFEMLDSGARLRPEETHPPSPRVHSLIQANSHRAIPTRCLPSSLEWNPLACQTYGSRAIQASSCPSCGPSRITFGLGCPSSNPTLVASSGSLAILVTPPLANAGVPLPLWSKIGTPRWSPTTQGGRVCLTPTVIWTAFPLFPFVIPALYLVEAFLDALIAVFGDCFMKENAKRALLACKQGNSTSGEYNSRLSSLVYLVKDVEEACVERYVLGLNPCIVAQAMSKEWRGANTLDKRMDLATEAAAVELRPVLGRRQRCEGMDAVELPSGVSWSAAEWG